MHKNKITALFSLIIFSAFEVLSFSPHVYAQEILLETPPAVYSVSRFFQPDADKKFLQAKDIPASIEETYNSGANGQAVILIQDAHAVADAQKAIRSLILFLTQNYGIHLVGVEGAAEQLDTVFFKAYPQTEAVENLFEEYLSGAEISGAAAAAVSAQSGQQFLGVEDRALYEAQINTFLASLAPAQKALENLSALTARLDVLKKKHYSAFLYAFDQRAHAFSAHKTSLVEFMQYLLSTKIARPDSGMYPHLAALFAEFEGSDYVTRAQADRELKRLYEQALRNSSKNETLQLLHAKNQAYQTERISAGAFAEFLIHESGQKEDGLSETLKRLVRQYRVLKDADGKDLMREFENFIVSVKSGLMKTGDEKILNRISYDLDLAARFLELKLLREEQQSLHLPELAQSAADPSINSLESASHVLWYSILEEQDVFRAFYQIALEREQVMIQKTLKAMKNKSFNEAVLVTGGFHTEGVKQILKQRGISYVVITPQIESLEEENNYLKFMRGQVSWRDYFEEKNGRIRQYDAFVRSARDRLLAGDEEHKAYTLKEWRDSLIHELVRKNRITEAADYTRFIDEAGEQQKEEKAESFKKEWLAKVDELVRNIRLLNKQNNLSLDALSHLAGSMTAVEWTASPLERGRTFPAAWVSGKPETGFRPVAKRQSAEQKAETHLQPAAVKSELRQSWVVENTPEVLDYTAITRQMEQGVHRGIIKKMENNPRAKKYVPQLTLTGGLGALQHDAVEAWGANYGGYSGEGPANLISIVPVFEFIKAQEITALGAEAAEEFGDLFVEALEPTEIKKTLRLKAGGEFGDVAKRFGSKAAEIIDQELEITYYQTFTHFSNTPTYYIDIHYTNPGGKRVRLFDAIYPDEKYYLQGAELKLWRDVHMVAYNLASQILAKELQKQKKIKDKLIFIENEGFASLPLQMFPDAIRDHRNHTVFRHGLPKSHRVSYDLMGYPVYLRPEIINPDGSVDMIEAIAIDADFITGVGLAEHHGVLYDTIFPAHRHKLWQYNQDGLRNTNGAFMPQWQADERRALLEYYRGLFEIDPKERDEHIYNALEQSPEHKERFKKQQENVNAAYVGQLLIWLADEQQLDALWLRDTMKKYQAAMGQDEKDDDEALAGFRAKLQQFKDMVEQAAQNPADWTGEWSENEWNVLREVLMADPIISNVRRQVAYKGPEKWHEIFEFLENPDKADAARWVQILELLGKDKEALKFFRENAPRVVLGGRLFHQGKPGVPQEGGRELFEKMKGMINQLQLEDRVTFIEDYTIENAELIFKAVAGTVMLSDEFLEASATSMMKAMTNFGALIIVWGGAGPELLTIKEVETGREIDIFEEKVTHDQVYKNTHATLFKEADSEEVSVLDLKPEEIRQRLESGEWVQRPPVWRITNGWLAAYAPYEGPGSEQSTQQGGKRRPSAQSLVLALKGLRDTYRDAESRRELQFNVGASSYKVDMEKGQARAQLFLWQRVIRERQKKSAMFEPLKTQKQQALESARKIVSVKGEGFPWQRKPDPAANAVITVATSEPGLLGFLQGFKKVRNALHSIGDEDIRGVEAIWSISHHSSHFDLDEASDYGDIFNYFLKAILKDSGEALQPVKERIRELAKQARASNDTAEKVTLTLEAIDLMQSLALELTRVLFESAAEGNSETEALFTLEKDPNFLLRRELLEYIERNSLNQDPEFYEADPARRQAFILENMAHEEQVFKALTGDAKSKPVVQMEKNYPGDIFAGQDVPVYALADLKELAPEDVHIDLLYRDVHRDPKGQWRTIDLDHQIQALGGGKYALQSNLNFSRSGHYELAIRIRPRNEMFWIHPHMFEAATSTSYLSKQINVRNQNLLKYRAEHPVKEGRLFYVRIPEGKVAQSVLWMSDATKDPAKGAEGRWEDAPVEMQPIEGEPGLWAVVIDHAAKPQEPGYYEFRMVAKYTDGLSAEVTGDYDVVHRQQHENASVHINQNHFSFKAEAAGAELEKIDTALAARSASSSLLELYFPVIEPRAQISPGLAADFRRAHIAAELPAVLLEDAGRWRFYVHYGYVDDPRTWQTVPLIAEESEGAIKLSIDLELIPYDGNIEYKLVAAPASEDIVGEDIGVWSPRVFWSGRNGSNHSLTMIEDSGDEPQQTVKDRLALEILQAYAQGRPKARDLLKRGPKGDALRTIVSDYLQRHASELGEADTPEGIKLLKTNYSDILAFAVPWRLLDEQGKEDEDILVMINADGVIAEDVPGKLYPDGAAYILGETVMEDKDMPVSILDLNQLSAREKNQGRGTQIAVRDIEKRGIALGGVLNLNMFLLQPANPGNIGYLFSAAIKGEMYKGEPAAVHIKRLILQRLTEGSQEPANINKRMATILRPVAKLNKADAEQMFGKEGAPAVMGFIAVLAPEVFRDEKASLETWNKDAYARIFKAITDESQNLLKVFSQGTLETYSTKQQEAILFSREHTASGRKIFFPFLFSSEHPNTDGKRLVSVADYKELGINFLTETELPDDGVRRGHRANDVLLGVAYSKIYTAASFARQKGNYHFKVPVIPRGWDKHGVRQEGWRFQMIELVPVAEEPGKPVYQHDALMVPVHLTNWSYEPEHFQRQTPDGNEETARFVPVDSIHKTRELLIEIAAHGAGMAYLYGGTDKLGELAESIHSVEADGRSHFFSQGEAPGKGRVTVQIEGGYGSGQYKTRLQEHTLADGRKVVLQDNQGNPFSIHFNGDVNNPQPVYNPVLTNHRDVNGTIIAGTPEETERQIAEMNTMAHDELGLKMAGDVIFWLSPEDITKENYHWTFHKKMEGSWLDEFRALGGDHDAKQNKINALLDARQNRGYFSLWFEDERGQEQVILIKHFESEGIPHKDQVFLNPYVPQVMQYYKNKIKKHIELGFEIGRVDLAAKLLQSSLAGIMHEAKEVLGLTSGAEFEARQIYTEIFEYANQLAEQRGIVFTFVMEMYNDDEKKIVRDLAKPFANINAVFYYEKVTQELLKTTRRRGLQVQELENAMRRPFDALVRQNGIDNAEDPGFLRLISSFSNFDNISRADIGGASLGVILQQVAVANAGAWVMLDLRDLTGIDPIYPIPGGRMAAGGTRQADPDHVDGHSAAKKGHIDLYASGWEALIERVRSSDGFAVLDYFNQAIRRTGESWFTFLSTGDQTAEKAVSALAFQEKESLDWIIIAVDHRYWEHKPREIFLPSIDPSKLPAGYKIEAIEVTLDRDKLGENLEIKHPWRIENLIFSEKQPYKIIRLTAVPVKSEVRTARQQRSELRKSVQSFLQRWAVDGQQVFDLIGRQLASQPEALAAELTAQAPRFAGNYASRALASDGVSSNGSVERYLQYQNRLNLMIPKSILEIENEIREHLDADLKNNFHFNAIVPFSQEAGINDWWKNFLSRLEALQQAYGDRVSADVLMLTETKEQGTFSAKGVELLSADEPTALRKITSFLDQHENALAFSLPEKWSRALKRSRQGRLVELSGLRWQEAFPVTTAIAVKAAQIDEVTAAQLLRQIPQQFDQGIFGYEDGALVIYEAARNLVLNASIAEMIATMA